MRAAMSPASGAYWVDLKEWPILVALAIGLLIGLERERVKIEGPSHSAAGLRTYALVAALGATAATIGNEWLVLVAGGFITSAAKLAHALGDRKDTGLISEVALVLTFILGVLAQSRPDLALELGVVTATLLAFRVQLHQWVMDLCYRGSAENGSVVLLKVTPFARRQQSWTRDHSDPAVQARSHRWGRVRLFQGGRRTGGRRHLLERHVSIRRLCRRWQH